MADRNDQSRATEPDISVSGIEGLQSPQNDTTIKTWKGYIWDTWELPPDQRWLLFKVDAFVLTFASIGYFLKNIDQTNVNNAFLSGMKEDLNMYGNQLVTSVFPFLRPYAVGIEADQHPSRHFHLDSWLCDWTDSFQSTTHSSFAALGDPVIGSRLGYSDDLYIFRAVVQVLVRT